MCGIMIFGFLFWILHLQLVAFSIGFLSGFPSFVCFWSPGKQQTDMRLCSRCNGTEMASPAVEVEELL
uniref:Putative secreted protein n=1 Tax=Anopheles darlingi TaxID=43151 RepID=A0A2M4D783_ANODA